MKATISYALTNVSEELEFLSKWHLWEECRSEILLARAQRVIHKTTLFVGGIKGIRESWMWKIINLALSNAHRDITKLADSKDPIELKYKKYCDIMEQYNDDIDGLV